jgi:hypothetical protein
MKLLRWGERGAEKTGALDADGRVGQLVRLGIDGLGVQTQRIVAHA